MTVFAESARTFRVLGVNLCFSYHVSEVRKVLGVLRAGAKVRLRCKKLDMVQDRA
jgi:hypothetical protein